MNFKDVLGDYHLPDNVIPLNIGNSPRMDVIPFNTEKSFYNNFDKSVNDKIRKESNNIFYSVARNNRLNLYLMGPNDKASLTSYKHYIGNILFGFDMTERHIYEIEKGKTSFNIKVYWYRPYKTGNDYYYANTLIIDLENFDKDFYDQVSDQIAKEILNPNGFLKKED